MAGSVRADMNVREASISAVITRADGRVEDLGVVSFYHRNLLRRLMWNIGRLLKGK